MSAMDGILSGTACRAAHHTRLPLNGFTAAMPCCSLCRALQEERTQGRNRERAMALLRAKLFELELEKQRR